MKEIIIGIDTGVKTGIAVFDRKKGVLTSVETTNIIRAQRKVLAIANVTGSDKVFVRFEDARLRKWFGKSGHEKLQGAGSVKRDASVWETFLKEYDIPYEAVAPKNNITKRDELFFKQATGWENRTDQHCRDAAMLVYGY